MEVGIQQLLVATPAVSALLGTRVYPLILPEAVAWPAATYQGISCIEEQTLDGPTGIFTARVQIDTWSDRYLDAKAAAAAIRAVLDGYSGALPDGTIVSNLWLCDSAPDHFEPEPRLFRCSQDFKAIYSLS